MVRFLHIFPIDSPVFTRVLIEMINQNCPNAHSEHLFYCAGEKNFCTLSAEHPNVRHTELSRKRLMELSQQAEHLILHSLFLSSRDIRRLPNSFFDHATWCVWGHDLYHRFKQGGNWMHRLKGHIAIQKLRHLEAISIGFKYDSREIRRILGEEVRILPALYGSGYYHEDIDAVEAPVRDSRALEIMVGHCAYETFNHLPNLDRLVAYRDENIRINLVLSYGDAAYRERVIAHARSLFREEQLHIQTEMLSPSEYIRFLKGMDVVVMDFERQAAFGNLITIAYLKKKLFLSPTGIMSRAFREEGIPIFDCRSIGSISFEEFAAPGPDYSIRDYIFPLLDKPTIIAQWKNLFEELTK